MLPSEGVFGTQGDTGSGLRTGVPDRARRKPQVVLTIAGFDPGSGAGITADLLTFQAHGLFGTACITALTVQSTLGVRCCEAVSGELIGNTLIELERDFELAGVKIGMLGDTAAVESVSAWLAAWRACAQGSPSPGVAASRLPVVLDPVLRSSSGAELLSPSGLCSLQKNLVPLVDWLTPNRAELVALGGLDGIRRENASLKVLVTGGEENAVDVLHRAGAPPVEFRGRFVASTSTHGTGCALSSALLAGLVRGLDDEEAVRTAKRFVEGAMENAPGVGHGRGPMDLLWPLRR